MANRLKDATSPYLLQHADNPVDWWPWCDEAFAEARRRDVPVLLSVGYAACHWCHVMAHESFEDPATAALLNSRTVAIKVDREERPDVDAVYMAATQAMTGQGGWPMTVFMTPDRDPFYCGTYFPREQFTRLVEAVWRTWQQDRGGVTGQAKRISAALAANAAALAGLGAGASADADGWQERLTRAAGEAVTALEGDYDPDDGGFGGAPKFPPSMVLEFLLRHHERAGSEAALRMAEHTCGAMARGGMYDQLGGGFARYSVDAEWVVPHFEKMLYDNALLARVYAHLWRRTGSELARRVSEETCDWMIRELHTPEGGLAASLDADSEGEEGRFYVWTPAELREILGADDAGFAMAAFGVTESGTFEHGSSVLQRREEPDGRERFDRIRGVLFAAREGRARPARDDKVVAAWNGLAIAALAEAGLLLDRGEFTAAALGAAELLAAVHLSGDRLVRTSRDGVPGGSAGLLEDYACVAAGLLALSGVTGQARWVGLAGRLLDTVLTAFGDGEGGFCDTAGDGERLIFRPADPADNATPSGTFAAADALLSYSALTGSRRHRDAAGGALRALPDIAGRYPRAAGTGLAVAEAMLSGPAEIAITGDLSDPRTQDLLRTALHVAPPGAVLAAGHGTGAPDAPVPLLAGRGLVNGAPAAYVCRQFTCQAPVTSPSELRRVAEAAIR
ncbi:MAG: thioredoxin domain-containing protein [Streptosporangiaceae bacterium]|nr:thioredoxin domain-containing protein [Streptosporangiaceae bacterium]MBV9853017.1 thioredoxin domain-containing protein [Streptosporangiaceae bacterium]